MRLNLTYDHDDVEILTDLDLIDHRRYVVRNMVPPGYESYFQEQARYISAHTSTAIEGNPLSNEEAMIVLVEGANSDNPDELEKVNLEEAYDLISQLASDKSVRVDEGIIRTLNSITLKGLPDAEGRGKYRTGGSLIVDSDTRAVRYRPPPHAWVPSLMKGLVADIEVWMEEEPPPVAAALTHFGLISIHPFDDGNGRTARLVADLILELKGWSVEGMLSVSKIVYDRHRQYYEVLRSCQGENYKEALDVTEFVNFQTGALFTAAAELEDKVVMFNKRRDELISGTSGLLNERQVTALMFMSDVGPMSSSLYAQVTKCSAGSAHSDLANLLNSELVIREGGGRNTRYRVNPILVDIGETHEVEAQPEAANEEPQLERPKARSATK